MPDLETTVLLFVAGFTGWTISTFSGGAGSVVLLAAVTYFIRVKTIAPVITIASLIASPTRILVSWRLIEWPVVRWYLPGAICGAIVGSWIFTQAGAVWLSVIVGLFLISTPFQYRLGGRARSFPMRLPWFIPVSLAKEDRVVAHIKVWKGPGGNIWSLVARPEPRYACSAIDGETGLPRPHGESVTEIGAPS